MRPLDLLWIPWITLTLLLLLLLQAAVLKGNDTCLTLLLAAAPLLKGFDVNAASVRLYGGACSCTPLHAAALLGHTECVAQLVAMPGVRRVCVCVCVCVCACPCP